MMFGTELERNEADMLPNETAIRLYGSMFFLILLVFLLIVVCLIKKRKMNGTSDLKLEEKQRKRTFQVRIRVSRTKHNQINICCFQMDEKPIGELLASYCLEDYVSVDGEKDTVHLEQIYVKRGYRKKGIGKQMMLYLLGEMQKIEKEHQMQFKKIYGEIGRGGSDDPMLSVPFYKKIQQLSYGKEKKLVLQIEKNVTIDGFDKFEYYIVTI